jgi:integrase/recombinase XerD
MPDYTAAAGTAGHCDPSTTKLYDRRGYNPEKAASFFAIY